MSTTPSRPASDEAPISLSLALMGHLLTGAVKWPEIAALLVALHAWVVESSLSVQDQILAAAIGVVLTEVVMTLVQRPFVLKHRRPDPGSVLMTVLLLVAPIPCWWGVLSLSDATPGWVAAGVVAATAVFTLYTVLVERPWQQGDDRAEVARKWQATKDMTRDM
ncbi:hypothetical protein [Kytococcus sp. Marseille-QA3725]